MMASFGETLKRERELREISLRDIADATKINLRYLEALEQNRFEILPGGVFNKGFIRAYARFIGADGDALVDGYLQELAARDAATREAAASAAASAGAATSRSATAGVAMAAGGAGPAPLQPGLLRPAENPLRRIAEARSAERRRERQAARGVVIADTVPGAGGAAAIPIVTAGVGGPPEPAAAPAATVPARRFMPVIIVAGAAAVLVILFVGARSYRDSRSLGTRGVEMPSVPAQAPVVEEAAAPLPIPDVAAVPRAQEPPPSPAIAEPAAGEPPSAPPGTAHAAARPAASPVTPAPEPEARGPVVSPPAQSREPASSPEAQAQAATGMEFRVEAASQVWVQVACDGEDRINRSLQPGEGQTLRCLSLVRISATDAGAVRLFVNGVRCVPIGDPGTRVEGFAIRSEDYRAICPPGGASSDGRR